MKNRRIRKGLSAVLVLILGALLTGCNGMPLRYGSSITLAEWISAGGDIESANPVTAGEDLKIGCVVANAGADSYQSVWYDEIKRYAEESEVNLTVLNPAGDVAVQSSMTEDLIALGCDCIILWPINKDAGVSQVREIYEAGIPCITANTDVNRKGQKYVTRYIGPSNLLEGRAAGNEMAALLNGQGNIVVIDYLDGYTASDARIDGMKESIEGMKINILDEQSGESNREKSQQIMENYLVRYSKGTLDAVFCYDDTTAIGALNAIQTAGRDEILVIAAACGSYDSLQYIRNGEIDAMVLQSPILETHAVLNAAIQIAEGTESVEYARYIETPVVTQENIDTLNIEKF